MHFRHDWREVGRHFNPPDERGVEVKGPVWATTGILERGLHGFTQVEYACRREGCTKRKLVEYLGRLPERAE